MTETLRDFFAEFKIEYFAVLDYKHVREQKPHLIERTGIDAKSVIIFLLPYYLRGAENLSAYATSLDYHIAIKEITDALIARLSEELPDNRFVGFGDHSPIDERHAALIAGLGVLGKNGLLINEKYGTYVFIADVITDVEPAVLGAKVPGLIGKCVGCGSCLSACPTGILRGKGDSCLSFITQKKGELSESEAALMRRVNTAWGCDVCQEVCPHNRDMRETPIDFFARDRILRLDSETLASLDEDQFKKRAFAWRGRAVVERNVKILEET